MPAEAARLATAIERTVLGPVWHGDALATLLADIGPTDAAAYPIASAHSIWELVLHIAAWAAIAEARLASEPTDEPDDDENWPPVGRPTAVRWQAALSHLGDAHTSLAAAVMQLSPTALDARVTGRLYTVRTMLQGVVEHGAYHGGQIAFLTRARASGRSS